MVQKINNLELEIILVLIKSKVHLREISRILKESHSTILRKMNILLKENIIDYKEEGKNKTFFIKNNLKAKNYIYSAEIYKFSKLLKKYPELEIIFEEIKNKFSQEMIILFGSYAKGIAKKESDIDIFIETQDKKVKSKIEYINSKINVKIGKFDMNSLLIKEINKNHIIIKGVEKFYEKNKFFETN
ncbi:MAG: nucleotidyltransferase domain-containing protein [Nanoarchaeota archaeon]